MTLCFISHPCGVCGLKYRFEPCWQSCTWTSANYPYKVHLPFMLRRKLYHGHCINMMQLRSLNFGLRHDKNCVVSFASTWRDNKRQFLPQYVVSMFLTYPWTTARKTARKRKKLRWRSSRNINNLATRLSPNLWHKRIGVKGARF